MTLQKYKDKRHFDKTPEPRGAIRKNKTKQLSFVVQEHHASHLHYDFRLEYRGSLLSWAVPKGPSMKAGEKRLAMHVEDHPLEYGKFEGVIPKGNYGAGTVKIWDKGFYYPLALNLDKEIKFLIYGHKLKGLFTLVKMKNAKDDNAWLLIKKADEFAENRITKKTKMPREIEPMLAKLVEEAFDRPDWLFEIKWDGYRAIAEVENGKVRLYSRNGLTFKDYKPVSDELTKFKHNLVLDGEIIALKKGRADFHTLQDYERSKTELRYVVFDLLYIDGEDLRVEPLRVRRKRLKEALPRSKIVLLSEGVEERGKEFFEKIKAEKFEGMVAKDLNSKYEEGRRSGSWLKIKQFNVQEAIIIGFTEPRGSRKRLGALVLGAYDKGRLKYIGHSGGGFSQKELKEVHEKLLNIKTLNSPVEEKVPINSPITWVKPKYVCEIKFSEWTKDGRMRHPIYAGMRIDKKPEEVLVEKAEQIRQGNPGHARSHPRGFRDESVKLTNLDKVFWPQEKYTKGDVINYYKKISQLILPYLHDRPESLLRQPSGIEGKSFFQKDVSNLNLPDVVETESIYSESNSKHIKYLLCQNEETLLYLANLGCIELNPWNSRVGNLDNPDYMILDLDPGKNKFEKLIVVALELKQLLDMACEVHFIKTSGKKGLHVMVPLGAKYDYNAIKTFAELLMQIIHRRLPDLTSIERTPSKRGGKIYLDYLQNRRGQTIAAPYSLRPWPGATVSTPLKWSEVKKGLDPADFNIKTIHKRIEKYGDLWQDFLSTAVDLEKSIKCLEDEIKKK